MTTAVKQAYNPQEVLRRFTEAAVELIDMPEAPKGVREALLDVIRTMGDYHCTEDESGYARHVLGRVFGLSGCLICFVRNSSGK